MVENVVLSSNEIVPFADTSSPLIRVTNSIVTGGSEGTRAGSRNGVGYLPGVVSYFSNKASTMNLGRVCYDCQIARMILIPILKVIGDENRATTEHLDEDWSESFATPVTMDVVEIET